MQQEWNADDLIASWTLTDSDHELIGNKTGATRLGFVLLLKFFEIEARFPNDRDELPLAAVEYVALQLKIKASELARYSWSERAIKRHRAQIRAAFDFRETTVADSDKLALWLAEVVCPVELGDDQLHAALLMRCRKERLEPPGESRIERIVGYARASFETEFTKRTVDKLGPHCVAKLESLVDAVDDDGERLLAQLKADPGRVGLETMLREIDKLAAVRALGVPADLFSDASDKLVDAWRARAARSYPSDLRASPVNVRLTPRSLGHGNRTS